MGASFTLTPTPLTWDQMRVVRPLVWSDRVAVRSLLIKPRKTGSRREYVSANLEPLGLLSIAAFVRKYSAHTIAVLDAQAEDSHIEPADGGLLRMGMSDAGLRATIEAFQPRVVGISALFEVL